MQLGSLGKAKLKAAKSLTTWEYLQQRDGIAKDSTKMFVDFFTLEENKGLFLLSMSSLSGKDAPQPLVNTPLRWVFTKTKKVVFSWMEVTTTQRLDWDQCWAFHPKDSHPMGLKTQFGIE